MPTYIEDFADWAATLTIDDIPDDVRATISVQLANALAAARAGTTAHWLEPPRSDGDATALGGVGATVEDAAFTNAAASMVHDYDDYCFMGHTGHSAVFAPLALCDRDGLDGASLLTTMAIANELEGRLGGAAALGPHNGQMWAFIHQAGAAAAAARIVGDDAESIADAVQMALYSPPYPTDAGFMDSDAKALTAAAPTASGLRIGAAAARGASGSPAALESFLETYAYVPFPEMVTGFGDAWVSRTLCFKPRPGCAYVQTPLECLEQIDGEVGLEADQVDSITVRAPLTTYAMECLSRPYRQSDRLLPVSVTFSVEHSLALHLHAGGVEPAVLTDEYIAEHRQELDRLAAKVTLEHDWGQTARMIDGMSAGVDFSPLIRDRGLLRTLGGFWQFGREHQDIPRKQEIRRLLRSGQFVSMLDAFRSPLNWREFDLSQAHFDELEFAFGGSVAVEQAGAVHRASSSEHAGSCARPTADVAATVRNKFEREIGDGFDVVRDAENRAVDDLVAYL